MKTKTVIVILLVLLVLVFGCTGTNTAGFPIINQDKNTDNNILADNNSNAVVNNLDQFKIAKSGDSVSVDYTGRFTDGKIFDSSKNPGRTPLEFVIDDGGMIKGFNDAVKGMKVGETKTVTLPPELAYGVSNPANIHVFDKNQFADFNSITVGQAVGAGSMQGKVIEKTDQNATIDFNPEMAGKTLIFEITLLKIQ